MADETTDKPIETQPRLEYGYPDRSHPAFYTNHAQFSGNVHELRIDFCEIQGRVPDDKGDKLLVTPQVRMYMSWSYVKRFAEVLQKQIQQHEEKEAKP